MKILNHILIVTLLLLMQACRLYSQVDSEIDARLEKRSHTFENTTLPYRLYVPDNYSNKKSYPVLIFLHGAQWAGADNITQLDNELALYWIDSTFQTTEPCFVVYPQIPSGKSWESSVGQVDEFPASPNLATANDILTQLLTEFSIEKKRIYVCGKSIGGLGVYGMIARYPARYAAAIPAAGRYMFKSIDELAECSLWIFHNKDDTAVPISQSRFIVEHVEKAGKPFVFTHCNFKSELCDTMSNADIDAAIQNGARFIYSEFDDSGHQLEPNVVATHGLYHWTMAQKKGASNVRSTHRPKNVKLIHNYPNPFNSSTSINFVLQHNAHISLTIKNVAGQTISVLENEWINDGSHSYIWHADGNPSGVYFYEMATGDAVQRGRCLLLK